MNSRILILPVIGVTTFFILLFTFTKVFGPIPFSINSVNTTKSTTFDVTGEGKVTSIPDAAMITIGVQESGLTVKEAQNKLNSSINKVSEVVKKLGIDSKDIQTTNYNINPEYDYSNDSQRIKAYSANTNLQIKVRQLENVNSVIDIATANGANQIGGISFDINDKSKLENEARQKAVLETKKKAADASKIAGFKLGKIINYSENIGSSSLPPIRAMAIEKAIGGAPTKVETGTTDITVSVTLSYEIQ